MKNYNWSEQAIAEAAYYIWLNNGCPANTSTQDWNAAINQLNALANAKKACIASSKKTCVSSSKKGLLSSLTSKKTSACKTTTAAKKSPAKKTPVKKAPAKKSK